MSSQWKITLSQGFVLKTLLKYLCRTKTRREGDRRICSPVEVFLFFPDTGLHPADAALNVKLNKYKKKKTEWKLRESAKDRTVCPSAVCSFLFLYFFLLNLGFARTFSGISAALSKLKCDGSSGKVQLDQFFVGVWPRPSGLRKRQALK